MKSLFALALTAAAALLPLTAARAWAQADSAPTVEQLQRQVEELQQQVEHLKARDNRPSIPAGWLVLGFLGQTVFGLRFVVQWIASERAKKSVVPLSFWYLSLVGSITLLTYAIYRVDWVFIAGFSLNMIIYVRNLYFIHVHPRKLARAEALGDAEEPVLDEDSEAR